MNGQCIVCGSSAVVEREPQRRGFVLVMKLCRAHEFVCDAHMKDPCEICDGGLMGYWNQDREGHSLIVEDTGLVWGDAPADAIDDALAAIVSAFKEDVGRLPTKGEIRAGLEFSLMQGEDDEVFDNDPNFTGSGN